MYIQNMCRAIKINRMPPVYKELVKTRDHQDKLAINGCPLQRLIASIDIDLISLADLKVPFLNKAFLRVKAYDNHNLDGIHLKEALHRRCIEKLYDDDPERDDLLIYISSLCRRYKVSPHVEGCFQ
ncbi:hypothetical protein TRIUR3_09340 [Triticum urartu]|uniref:Uncharacterized protein n=1 Tax=Triticum urartu TaxID=4572 RepID=M8A0Y5_TRIUA|nr:hypothetical protein TRIUR3_09340 [Triticum urartu]